MESTVKKDEYKASHRVRYVVVLVERNYGGAMCVLFLHSYCMVFFIRAASSRCVVRSVVS